MQLHQWDRIPPEQMNPLCARQVIHTDQMTIARLYLKKGALVPRHSHPNEQVTLLLDGRLLFRFDDGETEIAAGAALQIPGGAPHEVISLEDSFAIDVFSPPRQDWIAGADSYLRGR